MRYDRYAGRIVTESARELLAVYDENPSAPPPRALEQAELERPARGAQVKPGIMHGERDWIGRDHSEHPRIVNLGLCMDDIRLPAPDSAGHPNSTAKCRSRRNATGHRQDGGPGSRQAIQKPLPLCDVPVELVRVVAAKHANLDSQFAKREGVRRDVAKEPVEDEEDAQRSHTRVERMVSLGFRHAEAQ